MGADEAVHQGKRNEQGCREESAELARLGYAGLGKTPRRAFSPELQLTLLIHSKSTNSPLLRNIFASTLLYLGTLLCSFLSSQDDVKKPPAAI